MNFKNDVVNISYDPNGIIHYSWNTTPTSEEFRFALNKGLEVIKATKANKWVGDVRQLGAIDVSDQTWVNTEWFPSALQLGIKKMAVILGDDIFNQMSVEEIMNNVEGSDFVLRYFPGTEEAVKWLKDN